MSVLCTITALNTNWGIAAYYTGVSSVKEKAEDDAVNDFLNVNMNPHDFQGDSVPNELFTNWSIMRRRQFRSMKFETIEEVVEWINSIPNHVAFINYHEVPTS